MDALRISPKYTSLDWQALNATDPKDWPKAADVVRDRLEGRFLRFASSWLSDKHSGFVVLAIDSLLAETIQQFVEGVTDTHKGSQDRVKRFLKGTRFQPDFDDDARKAFHIDIRCGLLHQAEAKRRWLIRRKQGTLLQRVTVPHGQGYILDVERFHAGLQGSLNDYLTSISEPANSELRSKLWKKMDHICSVRTARGAVYETESDPASTQSSPQ
jgi:hypothetical protein